MERRSKSKKNKITTVVLILSIILLSFFLIAELFQKQKMGDHKEREELLIAVMWEISKEESPIQKEEIQEIKVLKAKAGVYPFNFDVAINMKNGTQLLYSWKDKNKTEVVRSNID